MLAAAEPVNFLDLASVWAAYKDTLVGWVLNVAAAAAILILGAWVAGVVKRTIRARTRRSARIDDTLGAFFASLAYYAVLAFVLIAVLNRFGVQTTSLVAVLGAATLAIGLALQGTLSDLAAGVMVILFRPYRLGDYVEVGGKAGTVKDINIFTTELATPDNVKIILPNGQCWGDPIVNYSSHAERRCDITFGISYDDDIDKAIGVILEVVKADGRFLDTPAEPWVRVVNLNDSSVDLQLRAWVAGADYWEAKFATIKGVKQSFDAAGVEIPYPHQVEIKKDAA